MTFLAPLFLVGLAGLAIPVILHLIQKERKNVVQFPSLMFLRRIPYQSVQRRRIRHWFLLFLRLAAQCFQSPLSLSDQDGIFRQEVRRLRGRVLDMALLLKFARPTKEAISFNRYLYTIGAWEIQIKHREYAPRASSSPVPTPPAAK